MAETKALNYYQKKGFFFTCKLKSTDADKLLYTTTGKSHERLVLRVTDGVSEEKVEVFTYGQQDNVYYKTSKNEFVNVPWSERNNSDVVKGAAYQNQFTVNLGKKETYITSYDFIKSICEHMRSGKLDDKVLSLRGEFEYKLYNGEVQRTLNLKSIGFAEENAEMNLTAIVTAIYKKGEMTVDSVNKKIILNGYVQEYVKLEGEQNKQGRMFPQAFIMDYGKSSAQEAVKNAYLNWFDGKDDKYYAICLECKMFKGAGDVKVKPLTDEQKLYIDLGFLTEEQAIKDNTAKDDNVLSELRVKAPVISKEPYTRTVFIPENTDKFVFGFDVVKDSMFDNNDSSSSLFEESSVNTDDLDSLFA